MYGAGLVDIALCSACVGLILVWQVCQGETRLMMVVVGAILSPWARSIMAACRACRFRPMTLVGGEGSQGVGKRKGKRRQPMYIYKDSISGVEVRKSQPLYVKTTDNKDG